MSADSNTIDGTAEEEAVEPTASQAALVPTAGPALAVAPTVKATELVERLEVIKQASETAMTKDVDYGEIPGTKKPTLLKPGAEKLTVLFQLDVQISNEKVWGPGEHLTVISKATAFHAPTGTRLGFGEGICTTKEKKYAKRRQELACPTCKEHTVFKSKKDPEFFCWKKKGGCGATFPLNDPKLTNQEVGEVENPDLPDLWNTVVKMAEKRARVDVVLAVTGASALFTQDIEDGSSSPDQERSAPQQAAQQSKPKLATERVSQIGKGIIALGLNYNEIALMLGACGADGLAEGSEAGLRDALETLTPEQADKVEAHLEKVAQDRAAEEPDQDGGQG